MRSLALLLSVVMAMLPAVASAQESPVGRWKTVDDETGESKAIVEIRRMGDGTLQGRIVELLQTRDKDPRCEKCSGANRDKPIRGMTILWGLREHAGLWTGGSILDPEGGRIYKAKLEVVNANRLGVSGCLAFICSEQVWLRN
jgi:uncharacterized protein (DUF2147 family)